jgi:2-dehydropantoate 2-reductase
MNMRIALLGAGSMGTIIGAYLSKSGYDVTLVDNYKEHVEALNNNGAHIIGSVDEIIPVKAVMNDGLSGKYDLVLSLTKQTTMKEALENAVSFMHDKTIVMTLQNGIPEDIAAEIVGIDRVLGGGMEFSGTFIEPGVSKLASSKETLGITFGRPDGKITEETLEIQKIFKDALGHCELTENLRGVRYTKLTDNACFSGLATALGCLVGDILDNRKAMECIAYTGREAANVINALDVNPIELFGLRPILENVSFETREELDKVIDYWTRIYTPYRDQKGSMLQDLEKGRVCEINQINGKFVDEGNKIGVKTPFNAKIVEMITKIQNGEFKLENAWSNLELFEILKI